MIHKQIAFKMFPLQTCINKSLSKTKQEHELTGWLKFHIMWITDS